MKIFLPNSAFLGNIDAFLKKYETNESNKLEITANEKWISVHPVVLSMVAALGLTVAETRCAPIKAASRPYFVRMGLFNLLGVDAGGAIEEHESAGRFIPLTQIKTSAELSIFITEMIPLLHLSPEEANTIGYIVSELVRNVIEHAQSSNGAIICAQFYKNSNSIRIGIADTGVGIKETITRSHSADTDLDALRLALRPGITGTTRKEGGTAENAGAGLFFIKSMAKVSRDFFIIYSGSGFYKLLRAKQGTKIRLYVDPFEDKHSKGNNFPYWQGTLVGVDITLDQTREFTSLLNLIRDTYNKDLREKKKAYSKRPRFV